MVEAHRYLAYAVIAGCLLAGVVGLVAYRRGSAGQRRHDPSARTAADAARRAGGVRAPAPLGRLPGRRRAALRLRRRRARRRPVAVVLRAGRPSQAPALVRGLGARRRGARRSWHHDRIVRRFFENRTVRGLAIVALIALVVVVLSLEPVLAAIGGLLGIAFFLAVAFFLFLDLARAARRPGGVVGSLPARVLRRDRARRRRHRRRDRALADGRRRDRVLRRARLLRLGDRPHLAGRAHATRASVEPAARAREPRTA